MNSRYCSGLKESLQAEWNTLVDSHKKGLAYKIIARLQAQNVPPNQLLDSETKHVAASALKCLTTRRDPKSDPHAMENKMQKPTM
ncbi:MAG: hypothetical protein OJF50_003770 [Nitrospira sp.]|jgi:hypothetical protein|nr:hypothetical protein [Nitrospira sp.]